MFISSIAPNQSNFSQLNRNRPAVKQKTQPHFGDSFEISPAHYGKGTPYDRDQYLKDDIVFHDYKYYGLTNPELEHFRQHHKKIETCKTAVSQAEQEVRQAEQRLREKRDAISREERDLDAFKQKVAQEAQKAT